MSSSVDLLTRWKRAVEVNDCEEGMVNFWRTSKAKKSVGPEMKITPIIKLKK